MLAESKADFQLDRLAVKQKIYLFSLKILEKYVERLEYLKHSLLKSLETLVYASIYRRNKVKVDFDQLFCKLWHDSRSTLIEFNPTV